MARRPQPLDEVLTRKELEDLQRRLSMMSTTAVQNFYQLHTLLAASLRGISLPHERFKSLSKRGSR